MRVLVTVGIGRIVVVRADRLGDAPIGHRQFGIEFRGMLKRPCGLVMIEAIDKAQTLVKELLRLRIVRGNGVMKIAQSGHQSDGMSLGMSVGRMILCRRAQAQQSTAQQMRQSFHLVRPPDFKIEIRTLATGKRLRETPLASAPSLCQIDFLAKLFAGKPCPRLVNRWMLLESTRGKFRRPRCSTPSTPITASIFT